MPLIPVSKLTQHLKVHQPALLDWHDKRGTAKKATKAAQRDLGEGE